MELVLAKDWAGMKKGDKYTTKDQSVIDKGLDVGLFENHKRRVKPLNLT